MKSDKFTKVVLTLIAINLTFLTAKNLDIIPSAYANDFPKTEIQPQQEYGLVPLNKNGTIDVNIKSFDSNNIMDVNIEEVGGYSTYGEVPVNIENEPLEVEID